MKVLRLPIVFLPSKPHPLFYNKGTINDLLFNIRLRKNQFPRVTSDLSPCLSVSEWFLKVNVFSCFLGCSVTQLWKWCCGFILNAGLRYFSLFLWTTLRIKDVGFCDKACITKPFHLTFRCLQFGISVLLKFLTFRYSCLSPCSLLFFFFFSVFHNIKINIEKAVTSDIPPCVFVMIYKIQPMSLKKSES